MYIHISVYIKIFIYHFPLPATLYINIYTFICMYLDNVVYQAVIYPKENINDKKYYIGVSSTNFKIRYGNHKYSFSHEHQKNQTALSKHYWGLKNKGLTPDIQWSILKRSSTPKSFDSRCNLCLEEKIHILLFPEPKILLNKRNELIARCRHRVKFKL